VSPAGDARIRLDEETGEFVLSRKSGSGWAEARRGTLRPQVGCAHYRVLVADGGACFAVWKTPYNYDEEKNTPLGLYHGDGTLLRLYGLFEIFDRRHLAEDIDRSAGFACPPHLRLDVEIRLDPAGAVVALRGVTRTFPVLPLDVLPLLLCDRSEADATSQVEALSSDDPERRAQAEAALGTSALRHESLLRAALASTRDPESRLRLAAIVGRIDDRKASARILRENPRVLEDHRRTLPVDDPLGLRIDAVLRLRR
jgi:hypothetical protein